MEELETVRATLARLEGSLEERRGGFELPSEESTSVKVVSPPEPEGEETWEPGETVRIIPPSERVESEPPEEIVASVTRDVERMRGDADPAAEQPPPEPETVSEETPGVADALAPGEPAGEETEPHTAAPDGPDPVEALFASLRGGPEPEEPEKPEGGPSESSDAEDQPEDGGPEPRERLGFDWIERREALLLPIINRSLRGLKKGMTELQNVALDALRTDEDWRPDPSRSAAELQPFVKTLWSESFAAGYTVAEEMSDERLKRPATPRTDAAAGIGQALAVSIERALASAADDVRSRQSAVSRVFRLWRTDEAERRLRELAIDAYELAIKTSTSTLASVEGP